MTGAFLTRGSFLVVVTFLVVVALPPLRSFLTRVGVSFLVVVFKGNSTTYVVTTLGVFLAASYRLLPSLYKIIQNIQDVKFHGASIDRILKEFKIINTQNKLVKNKTNIKFEENITFSNVDFAFW